MGPLAKLIGSGIGMTQEARAYRARSKSPQPQAKQPPASEKGDTAPDLIDNADADNDGEDDYLDEEEAQWELDEYQDDVTGADLSDKDHVQDEMTNIDRDMDTFFQRHPPPPYSPATGNLPLPVILPQKRPKAKARGFVRAYAPVLEDCAVDQETWFEFLDGFEKAIKYSKGFHAVNLAVAGTARAVTLAAPAAAIITRAVATSVHVLTEGSRRGYIRFQSNKYLDRMNADLFQPRGLYAMLVTYKPYSSNATEDVDWEQKTNAAVATRGAEGAGHKFGGTSGKTFKDLDVPESAPLIFPGLDAVPEEQKKPTAKETAGFVLGDYYDRRARAKFEHANPASHLNVASTPEFASRYSDPNHPSRNGNSISLLSGGKVVRPTARQRAKDVLGRGRERRTMLTGRKGRLSTSDRRGGMASTMKRKVLEDIVYLMVVNMPTEEEMQEALAGEKADQQAAKEAARAAKTADQGRR